MGSAAAMLLPANARNASAWISSAVALAALVLSCSLYAVVESSAVVRVEFEWLASVHFALRMDGFAWMFAAAGHRHRLPGRAVRALLHVAAATRCRASSRSCWPSWARMLGVVLSGNLIQLVFFWELTSLVLVPADRLLAPQPVGARRRAHGADRHVRRAACACSPACCIIGHIVGSYDLDRVLAAGDLIRCARALRAGAGPDPARRPHQERAVSVPLLAAARDGGADAGVGLPALGHDGEARRLPAGAAVAGAGRHRRMDLDRRHRPGSSRSCWARSPRSSSTTSRGCSPIRRSAISA